jgi:hypothetical protein
MPTARTLLIFFRWGIFLLACVHIHGQLGMAKGNQPLHALMALSNEPRVQAALVLVLLLMPLNWLLESMKWRRMLPPEVRPAYWLSLKATLAGTSLALVSPNRTGEFVARVLFLRPGERVQGAVAAMLGGVAQFVVTLVLGALALILFLLSEPREMGMEHFAPAALASLAALSAILAVVFFFNPGLLIRLLVRLPFPERWRNDLLSMKEQPLRDLRAVLGLSMLRYLVFGGQFVLLLVALPGGPGLHTAVQAVPVIFLVTTLIPTVLLTELGVRGSVALAVLAPSGTPEVPILMATFAIWAVNLMVPAIVGSVFLILARVRIRTDEP